MTCEDYGGRVLWKDATSRVGLVLSFRPYVVFQRYVPEPDLGDRTAQVCVKNSVC